MTRRASRSSRATTARRITRRRFMTLLAAGSAATLTVPARGLAVAAATAKRPGPGPKLLAEIEKQKKFVADTLKVIRAYRLPPGSDMAFAFRPLRSKRRK